MDQQSPEGRSIFSFLLSSEHATIAVMGVIVGLPGGFEAVGFRNAIAFSQYISYGVGGELLDVI